MRKGLRRLSALAFAMLVLFSAASASGAGFASVPVIPSPAPASLFDLQAARAIKSIPVCQAKADGHALKLSFRADLPNDVSVSVTTSDGTPVDFEYSKRTVTLLQPPALGWLILQWSEKKTRVTVQYLISKDGRCDYWSASADDGSRQIVRKGSDDPYELRITLKNVNDTRIYYNSEGVLLSSVLFGDKRESGSLPMILQYDEYGRAVNITAADTQHTYTYNRAEGRWEDESGKKAKAKGLPAFVSSRHPAPAANKLKVGTIHLSESGAGINRSKLLGKAPKLEELVLEDGSISFVSNTKKAELLVDGSLYLSTDQNTIRQTSKGFRAKASDIYADSSVRVALQRSGVTAVYQQNILESVSENASGVVLKSDGTLVLRKGAVEVLFNARGNMTEARIQSADGATLTYNRQGRLAGWEMDGYSWTKNGGWHTTAVNEKGNIIHPAVKQPAAVDLKKYPVINLKE